MVSNAKPTALIGVSGQPGAFTEAVVRAMARSTSGRSSFRCQIRCPARKATPADIERWSEGRAIIGAGSPFPPLTRQGATFSVDQTNNSYIFPGVGLGAVATRARRISDTMFMAAARALADMSPAKKDPEANLYRR